MELLAHRVPALTDALAGLPAPATHDLGADSPFWQAVRALYDVSRKPVNLENGYWGVMAEPVRAQFAHWTHVVNHDNTLLIRDQWPVLLDGLRERLARSLGCHLDEVVLTRGATEAMLALIGGYNRLRPGDTVLYCDLDYPAMRRAMEWLRDRRGVTPVCITMPEPASHDAVIAAYRQALQQHPRVRLVLLTHLSHCTGLVMPVAELSALAREAGAEVLVDAAHSWGQLDFPVTALDAPYVAFNLHKWIGAPLGCGALYIRRGALDAIDPYFGDRDYPASDIRCRIHTGSPNFAAWLSLVAALDLHEAIGARAKEARLRHLRNRWVTAARAAGGYDVLTPDDPRMVAGITSFRRSGWVSAADNTRLATVLRQQFGVLTVRRDGAAAGEVLRVTPAVHTTDAEVDALGDALGEALRHLPA